MLLRIMGWLLVIEAVFLLVPTITSLSYGESDWIVFGLTALGTALCGIVAALFSRPSSLHLGKRDGYLLTASVWVVFSLFGMIPLIFCTENLSVSDAFFEAMAGFTTTGASVMDPVGIGHGVHLWRAMMQWVGGLGIILFTIAIIPMLNHSGGMQMFNAEVTGITHEKISPRISQTAKLLWLTYFILTTALVLLLWAGPMDLFDSFCHAFGTISTGGYTSHPDGIAAWQHSLYVKVVLTVFMFLGGVNFALIFRAGKGQFKSLWSNEVFKVFVITIGIMFALFVISILVGGHYDGIETITIDPLFQVVSTLTSTGYVVTDFPAWGAFVVGLTFVMMFCGGCAGSTSGGAKIDRIIYLFKNTRNEIYRCVYPRSILSVKINNKVVSPDLGNKVISFLALYMLITVVGGLFLTICGVPTVDAFFDAFSCISNTGFDAGITGYGSNFINLPDVAKWMLSALMLTGRLEIFTIIVLFTSSFWNR